MTHWSINQCSRFEQTLFLNTWSWHWLKGWRCNKVKRTPVVQLYLVQLLGGTFSHNFINIKQKEHSWQCKYCIFLSTQFGNENLRKRIPEERFWWISVIKYETGQWWDIEKLCLIPGPVKSLVQNINKSSGLKKIKICFTVSEAVRHFTAFDLFYWGGYFGFLNFKINFNYNKWPLHILGGMI